MTGCRRLAGDRGDGFSTAPCRRGTAHFCDAVLVMEALSSGPFVDFVRHYVNDEIDPLCQGLVIGMRSIDSGIFDNDA